MRPGDAAAGYSRAARRNARDRGRYSTSDYSRVWRFKMSIVRNYRNAKLLLNAARKSRAPLGKLGNVNFSAAGQGDRTPPRAPSSWRERCSVAIRSLSFALKAVVVPQPRLFTVVNNVAYGYPLEEDPLGLIVKARWNDRVAELYSALTEQPAANHPWTSRRRRASAWRLSACRRWRIHGRDRGGRCWRCVPRRSIIWPGCAPMTGWIWRAPSMRWTSPTRCRPS